MSSLTHTPSAGDADVQRLFDRARRGDERAWRTIVRRYERLIAKVARDYGVSEADASDVAQITWLQLFKHMPHIKDATRLGGWLATTARRECIRVLRQSSRCCPHDELEWPAIAHHDDAEGHLLTAERDAALRAAMARLPDRDQSLLWLLAAEPPPSYAEISTTLQMPVGSIGPTRARSLRRLLNETRREAELFTA